MLSGGIAVPGGGTVLRGGAVHNVISPPAVKEGGNGIIVYMNRIVHFLAFYHLVGMGQLCGS